MGLQEEYLANMMACDMHLFSVPWQFPLNGSKRSWETYSLSPRCQVSSAFFPVKHGAKSDGSDVRATLLTELYKIKKRVSTFG